MIAVEWQAIPSGYRVKTASFNEREAMTRAEILAAIDGKPKPVQVAVVGCSVNEMDMAKKLEKRQQRCQKTRKLQRRNDLISSYFDGLWSYRSAIALSPRGTSIPPNNALMTYCEVGGIIASLPRDLRDVYVTRWLVWIAYQEAKGKRLPNKLELRRIYRNMSRWVAYKEASIIVANKLVVRGLCHGN